MTEYLVFLLLKCIPVLSIGLSIFFSLIYRSFTYLFPTSLLFMHMGCKYLLIYSSFSFFFLKICALNEVLYFNVIEFSPIIFFIVSAFCALFNLVLSVVQWREGSISLFSPTCRQPAALAAFIERLILPTLICYATCQLSSAQMCANVFLGLFILYYRSISMSVCEQVFSVIITL